MKLKPDLVRAHVRLFSELFRLIWWALMVVELITNYFRSLGSEYAELRWPLSFAQR